MLWLGATFLLIGSAAIEVQLGKLHIHGLQVLDDDSAKSNVFLGIPFAQPPVGELRWADPQPVTPPQEIQHFYAQSLPPACPQTVAPAMKYAYDLNLVAAKDYSKNISGLGHHDSVAEDCLYLNIFTPDNGNAKRPVMVWIHGGAFLSYSSAGFDGRSLATSQDVVVVVIQYRLGVFGFLSTEDSAAKGNWGLKDQTMALRWVQEHIAAFGGDASRVTIFGESAGGVSCGMHTRSPLSAGLFHNAILQSGTENMAMLYAQKPARMAKTLASQVGCDADDTVKLVACLRTKSPTAIRTAIQEHSAAAQERARQGDTSEKAVGLAFFPSVDGEFFPENPMTTKFVNPCNLIVGYNSDEIGYMLGFFFGLLEPITSEQLHGRLETLAQGLAAGSAEFLPKFVDALKQVYVASNDHKANAKAAQHALGDATFVANAFAKAAMHAGKGNVYVYELMHGVEFLQDRSLMDSSKVNLSEIPIRPADLGADHADDVPFVFGFPFNPNFAEQGFATTPRERLMSGIMMNFWGQFARTGAVRGWPAYNASTRPVLTFSRSAGSHIVLDPHPHIATLWLDKIPKLLGEMAAGRATRQDL